MQRYSSCCVIWCFEFECQQALYEHLISGRQSTGGINKARRQGASYLVIVADTAVRCGGRDLRCRCSQMAGAHDTGLGHPKAKDQVVSPQGYVTVPTARGAGLLCIHWVTGESFKKGNIITSSFLAEISRRSFKMQWGTGIRWLC